MPCTVSVEQRTTLQLIDDDIQGVSYDITTLPSLTQCVLTVVVHSDHCLLDVDGLLGGHNQKFLQQVN